MNIPEILQKIRPGEEWSLNGSDYEGLVWLSATQKPSREEIEAAWPQVKAELDMTPIRTERNRLLNEADIVYCNAERWSKMNAEKRAEWETYKQALRDLPASIDANSPAWPTAPA